MFYDVLLEHMVLKKRKNSQRIEEKVKKPHGAATRYLTLYAASSAEDAAAPDRELSKINMVLDRTHMWDCNKLQGELKGCYNFQTGNFNLKSSNGNIVVRNFMFSKYPCPSVNCACSTSHLVVREEFAPLPPCVNVALMGETRCVFQNLAIKRRVVEPRNAPMGLAVAQVVDIVMEEAEVIQDDDKVALSKLVLYFQTMFSEEHFVYPHGFNA
jgi:hypothetical protein